ncbi:protein-glutamine gamma-glutamyltransferase 2-like [Brachyhypopomus gauderio]|uniref:protein-glutamine gamma-glutamyltransferase 2-like n=1 Tax=Brachyhypopomus gauderio TaxID=698409 RepID=UPI0040413F64
MSQGLFDIDLQRERNNLEHHTNVFHENRLIVRRGQPFTLTLSLKSDVSKLSQATVIAETGWPSSVSSGTRVSMDMNGGPQDSGWSAALSQHGNNTSLTICAAPKAPIGKYRLILCGLSQQQLSLCNFVLLFNPWCADDDVYMESHQEREEYVMSQDGIIFKGNANHIHSCPWNFGQFESGILNVCLKILNKSLQHKEDPDRDVSQRGDPVYVTRVLSAMINANDDSGVLLGRWKKTYPNGVEPTAWTGSVEILHQWSDNNCKSVRYGQCWVFAAVGCTVTRALGIPCRVITNFESAHDTNGDLKIEAYVTENGETVKETVWNFHCWVESWMKRSDLKPGYDGWQVSDPTPQEQSEGVMCCGPVPVKAIKNGDLTCKYDAAFVYAEVNADRTVKWQLADGRVVDAVDTVQVGQKISTKKIGVDAREDVTHLYKHTEGSKLERESYRNAQVCQDFDLSIECPQGIKKGSDFTLHVLVLNKSSTVKKICLQLSSRGVLYNGKPINEGSQSLVKKHSLSPGKELGVPMEHTYNSYSTLLHTDCQLVVTAQLTDIGASGRMMEKRVIILEDPEINIQILGQPRVGWRSCAKLSVINPLPEELEKCCFTMEGSNLTNGETLSRTIRHVGPGKEASVKIYFTPTQSGPRKLMVDFYSKKLGHVKAYENLNVSK